MFLYIFRSALACCGLQVESKSSSGQFLAMRETKKVGPSTSSGGGSSALAGSERHSINEKGGGGVTHVDPSHIYFTFSRIRPVFSCGRTIDSTLQQFMHGELCPTDLPLLCVFTDAAGRYYSQNNRRLYIFKQLKEKGFLTTVPVRLRPLPGTRRMAHKYSPSKCSLTARLMGRRDADDLSTGREEDRWGSPPAHESSPPRSALPSPGGSRHADPAAAAAALHEEKNMGGKRQTGDDDADFLIPEGQRSKKKRNKKGRRRGQEDSDSEEDQKYEKDKGMSGRVGVRAAGPAKEQQLLGEANSSAALLYFAEAKTEEKGKKQIQLTDEDDDDSAIICRRSSRSYDCLFVKDEDQTTKTLIYKLKAKLKDKLKDRHISLSLSLFLYFSSLYMSFAFSTTAGWQPHTYTVFHSFTTHHNMKKRTTSVSKKAVAGDSRASGHSAAERREVSLRKKSEKRRSLSEIMNEQFDEPNADKRLAKHFDDEDGGQAEDYEIQYEDPAADDMLGSGSVGKKRGRAAGAAVAASGSSRASVLRRRGPLDDSLSTGKYASTPVNVEAAMDDLFGGLDMGDLDDEANDLIGDDSDADEDGEDGASGDERAAGQRPSKRKRVKDLSAEEYMEYVEKKAKRRKGAGSSLSGAASGLRLSSREGGNEEEEDILQQLELLRAQQLHLVQGAAVDGSDAEEAAAREAEEKQRRERTKEAVRYNIMLYSHLLRLRVKLQPAVVKAISLPQYYARGLFTGKTREAKSGTPAYEAAVAARKAVVTAYAGVRSELEGVLSQLYADALGAALSGAPEKKKTRTTEADSCPSIDDLQGFHKRVIQNTKTCLDFWGSRLAPSNSIAGGNSKLQTIHQPIVKQIEALLQVKSRLRLKIQKNRSHLPILGHPEHIRAANWFYADESKERHSADLEKAKATRATAIAAGDADDEVFDDGEFLRELVRRGGAVAAQLDQQLTTIREALQPTTEGSRKGFHRLTKGRAVDFKPRPKLVGFMVAESLDNCDPPRSEVVVRSLFQ
eukprot:gene5727-4088_t